MAAPIQTSEASAAASATTIGVAQGSNPTAGNVNLVFVRGPSGATVSGVADSQGNTYTARGNVTEAGTSQVLYIFSGPITTGGANTVTATYGASTANRGIAVVEYAGTYDVANTGTDTGNNPTTSVTATNSAQPATVLMLCNDVQGGTPAVGSGFTDIGTGWATVGLNYRLQYKTVTSVALQTGNFGNAGLNRSNTGLFIILDIAPPNITDNVDSVVAYEGQTANFSVTATGTGTLTYQWQRDTGGGFSDIGGETSSSLAVAGVTFSMNGYKYRVNVTDDNGTSTSAEGTLTVRIAAKPYYWKA